MAGDVTERVNASINLVRSFLADARGQVPVDCDLLVDAHDAVATFALGGKHLRSMLVHIAAGEVSGDKRYAAEVFGACIDLMHAAFLIHDDVIDSDDFRRGVPTIHSVVRQRTGDYHLGTSVAITAGDLAFNAAYRLLAQAGLPGDLTIEAFRIVTDAADLTIIGELLDIAHSVNPAPTPELVGTSNRLKTAVYSFAAPLKLGSLAAGRPISDMDAVAEELGGAYQVADDIAGAIGCYDKTGKVAGGDVKQGRATLMTIRLDYGLESEDLHQVVEDVIAEGQAHLTRARQLIGDLDVPKTTSDGLYGVADRIADMLVDHA